jgi:NAD(P)-dependent dehydrogenase (short-subunit alcohol dehydrogenase family)
MNVKPTRRIDMDLQLDGKLALVSGSTAGIGYAIARTLAQEGASVIVNGRSQAAVDEAVERIRSETHGTVLGHAGDLSRADAAEEVGAPSPGIGILVNNLGIFEPKAFEDIPDEDWRASSTSTCSAACALRAWCCRK